MWGVCDTPLPYRQERGCFYYPNHHHRPPDITKAGAALHCFRNVGPGLIASVRL